MNDVPDKPSRLKAFLATRPGWIVVAVAALLLGMLLQSAFTPSVPVRETQTGQADGDAHQASQEWTCSMHPQVRRSEPGLCPICQMELVEVQASAARGEPVFTTSQAGAAMMAIETAPVERRYVTRDVRMSGKVQYDETKLAYITAWVPGRLDRLFVDNTGVPVKAGEHLVEIYSPDLLSAQEELIQARRAVESLAGSDVGIVRETTAAMLEASREKLRLLGLTAQQITRIETTGKVSDDLTIYSPVSGIVVDKSAREGMYVQTGTRIYTIADLSQVWVQLDAYESDLAWLRFGQPVDLTTVAYPGETFSGTISLIHPILEADTRTVNVRVTVPNADGRLKPGMFARAVVHSRLDVGGRVMEASLANKYICTMHPEVIADAPGQCPECGMDLVATETLGYVPADEADDVAPLVIPATAPLITGRRAIVYVEMTDADQPTFEGREVVLGPKAGDWYIVREGLAEGQRVVVRGNFKIDSALQIQLRPSMISRVKDSTFESLAVPSARPVAASAALPAAFTKSFAAVLRGYLDLQADLARDDLAAARSTTGPMRKAFAVTAEGLDVEARQVWTQRSGLARQALQRLDEATDIEAARTAFRDVSQQVTALVRRFGTAGLTLYEVHCPMAFDNVGANWLQIGEQVANPYFGESMLRCGSVVETFGGGGLDE